MTTPASNPTPAQRYGVLVVGGGHAGAEAAWAAANMLAHRHGLDADRPEARVALVTLRRDRIGAMSCNPAIGGLAKGQMVREVDALGGLMGLAADATGIQFKVLNQSKGPAVRGPRCQSDNHAYPREVQRLLATRPNLDILEAGVERLHVQTQRGGARCVGVTIKLGQREHPIAADAVVLTTGTFMRGLMHTGQTRTPGGRVGEAPSLAISDSLRALGFELGRLKTGTPPRLAAESIDYDRLDTAPGDARPVPFSFMTRLAPQAAPEEPTPGGDKGGDKGGEEGGGRSRDHDPQYNHVCAFPRLRQVDCWTTRTDPASHDLIRANLDRAPMYNGSFDSEAGPRYCPSIEDKVVRFADKDSHHVFLEPESLASNVIYCNGISTSLPGDVQDDIVRRMPGCERAVILRYGYAVEYDMVWPHQIDATGMTKRVAGLFLAGQINGTSGYEEAAGQGLVAGVNAVRYAVGEDLLRLERDRAYIGVLMDDLITKTPREPYRMFTSRAEHRLLLRADNADLRLTGLARELGLIDDARWAAFEARRARLSALHEHSERRRVGDKPLAQWARQPGVTADDLGATLRSDTTPTALGSGLPGLSGADLTTYLADLQYSGYIDRHRREADRLAQSEHVALPTDAGFDYGTITGLRREAADKLNHFRPATLGQAGRLAGVNPADLMLIRVTLDRMASCASS